MEEMSYKEAYYKVVKRRTFLLLKMILREQKAYDPENIDKIQYEEEKSLPYLLIEVDSSEYIGYGNYGMLDGIFLNIDILDIEWSGWFYLPVLFIRRAKNRKMKELVARRNIKQHELEHLKGLLDYITQNPSYIQRALELNITGCTLENVDKSMAFEIEKLFKMEAPNLAKDYKNREQGVAIAEDGVLYEITVDSEEQFVKYKLGLYLGGLLEQYIERFPHNNELISGLYKKELDEQGRTLFGDNATEKAVLLLMELFSLKHDPERATRYEISELD